MAVAYTSLYRLTKPEVNASADVWGGLTNTDWDSVDKLIGAITTAAGTTAFTLTSGQSLTAYASGQRFLIRMNATCAATPTLNVDGLGAKAIVNNANAALAAGDLVSGLYYHVVYDGTSFRVVGNTSAKMAAIEALTWADDRMLDLTGANTIAVVTYATVLNNIAAGGLASANTWTNAQTSANGWYLDSNAYLFLSGGDPYLAGDSGDYIRYDRTSNLWKFFIGNTEYFRIGSSAITTGGAGYTLLNTNTGLALAGGTLTGNLAISKTTPAFSLIDAGGGPTTVAQFVLSGVYYLEHTAVNKLSVSTTVTEFLSNDVRIPNNPSTRATNSAGYLGVPTSPNNNIADNYTLVLADAGRHLLVVMNSKAITIPPNSSVPFPIGTTILICCFPGYTANTIVEGSGVTLYRGDGVAGSGTRTFTQYSLVTLFKQDTNNWFISGVFT